MLVKELKSAILKYSKEEKDKIIVELYKKIPKSIKEDYDIDNYIINFKKENKIKKEDKILTIDELENEVKYFLTCVNDDLYVSSNKIIPKDERSKWRFKVKRYYKELNSFDPSTPQGERATDLLKSLYEILSIGSVTLKFSSWETFRAIQISQPDFLENIMKRKLITGASKENIQYCVDLLEMEFDPYGWHVSLLLSFVSCLKTSDMKYLAIEILKEKVSEYKLKLKEVKNNYHRSFDITESINNFVECIIYIYFNLCEVDNAISYFQKNYIERHKEVKEYILLDRLERFNLDLEWIKEYESHNDINYRESLRDKYKELKRKIDAK